MGTLLAILLVVAIGPLCWLSQPLRASQLRGIVEYGELAVRGSAADSRRAGCGSGDS